jgi:L-serine dehydratase
MNVSIFDVVGPVMIGPSSSHTAGAARLARVARLIVGEEFTHISFGLYGSFAKTYKGHGTDKALVAGALGISESDEALSSSFEIAEKLGITYDFYEEQLEDYHQNSVKITFVMKNGTKNSVIGSSIGGGQILIRNINGFDTELDLKAPTIIIIQNDKKGVVSMVSRIIADNNLNIATMNLSRKAKGDKACCIIETDAPIPREIVQEIAACKDIISVKAINEA